MMPSFEYHYEGTPSLQEVYNALVLSALTLSVVLGSGALGYCVLVFVRWWMTSLVGGFVYGVKVVSSFLRSSRHTFEPEEELWGEVQCTSRGLHLSVQVGGRNLKVRAKPGQLVEMLLATRAPPVNESVIPTSLTMKSPLPSYQVSLLSDGVLVGSGFRVVLGGRSLLITAKHVLSQLKGMQGHAEVVSASGRKHALDKRLLVRMNTSFDVVAIDFPDHVAAALGVRAVNVGPTPPPGGWLNIHGLVDGESVRSVGVVGQLKGLFSFRHDCSTTPGYSGAPLIHEGRAVGVHLTGDVMCNWALGLDWLITSLGKPESVSTEAGYHSDVDLDAGDEYMFDVDGHHYRGFSDGRSFRQVESMRTFRSKYGSWADEDFTYDVAERGVDECVSPKAAAQSLTSRLDANSPVMTGLRPEGSAVVRDSGFSQSEGSLATPMCAPLVSVSKSQKKRKRRSRKLKSTSGHPLENSQCAGPLSSTQRVFDESLPHNKPSSIGPQTLLSHRDNIREQAFLMDWNQVVGLIKSARDAGMTSTTPGLPSSFRELLRM